MKNIFIATWLILVPGVFLQAQTPESISDTTTNTDKPEPCKDYEVISPLFPGGMKSKNPAVSQSCFQQRLLTFIQVRFKYPADAKNQNIEGRIIVQFVIGKNGTVEDAIITQSVFPSLDEEALRVIQSLPVMKPATCNGNPNRIRYNIPVVCRIL